MTFKGKGMKISHMRNLIDVLKERGFIDDVTSEELRDHLNSPERFIADLILQRTAFTLAFWSESWLWGGLSALDTLLLRLWAVLPA